MMLTKTTSSKTENFSYDGLNQLIGYTDGTTSASYAYNIEELRVRKTVNGQSVKHIWDSNKQIAVEYNPDEDVYTADVYVRGTNLLENFSYSHGAKSDYHYYSQNAHGDVVNISDSSSAIIKSYSYDAFGVEKNIDESDTNCFRYCGEYYDKETGTVYLRARYYDPGIGRFISRDSFTGKNEDPLSLNLYTYCHNNPIVFFDPNGHFKMPKWVEKTIYFVKGTAKEVPGYSLDLFMGLSNAVDEYLVFGLGNRIRENLGIDAYEPYDASYYKGTYTAGQIVSTAANAYMLCTGVGELTSSIKGVSHGLRGGSRIVANSNGVATLTSSIKWENAIEGALGVIKSGSPTGWAAWNIMYYKGGKQNIRNEYSQYSPEELEEMYKDPSTPKADRQKIKAAQKEKGARHSSQSGNKKRKK